MWLFGNHFKSRYITSHQVTPNLSGYANIWALVRNYVPPWSYFVILDWIYHSGLSLSFWPDLNPGFLCNKTQYFLAIRRLLDFLWICFKNEPNYIFGWKWLYHHKSGLFLFTRGVGDGNLSLKSKICVHQNASQCLIKSYKKIQGRGKIINISLKK